MQMHTHGHALPNAAMLRNMSIDELMDTTLRLSDILAEESEYMMAMDYKELPKLQAEKQRLSNLLESYQQVMAVDAGFLKKADAKTREELLLLTDDLAFNVEENFRKVAVARAVNSRIMQAIMDVVGDQHRPNTYGKNGAATSSSNDLALSMNLNQKA